MRTPARGNRWPAPARRRVPRSVMLLTVAWLGAGCSSVPYESGPAPAAPDTERFLARTLAAPKAGTVPAIDATDAVAAGDTVTVATLLAAALSRDRRLGGLIAGVDAALSAEDAVVRWRDPSLSVSLERHTLVDEIQSGRLGIGPQLSIVRRRDPAVAADRAARQIGTAAARARAADGCWRTFDEVLAATAAYLAARQASELAAEEVALLERGAALATARVEAGLTPAIERALLALSRNRARIDAITRRADAAEAKRALEAALNLGPGALPATLTIAYPLPTLSAALPPLAELVGGAVTARGDVLGALAAFEQSDATVRAEVAAQRPDLRLSPAYFFEQGDNIWSLLGGLVLPLAINHEPRIRAAMAVRAQRLAEFDAVQDAALQDVASARAGFLAARTAREALAEVLDAARADFDEVRAQRRRGSLDELALVLARHEVIRAGYDRIRLDRALRDAGRRFAVATRRVLGNPGLADITGHCVARAAEAPAP